MAKNANAASFTLALDPDGWYRSAPPGDTTAPTVPTNVSVTVGGQSSLTVSWTASTDAQSGVAYYTVYRATSAAGTYSELATTTGTSLVDSGLSAGTTYWYKVAATDNATSPNTSAQSSAASGTTSASSGSGSYSVLHEDDFSGAQMRSNYTGSPGFGGSVSQTGADYVGTTNPRWQASTPGDLCYNKDALIHTSTAHVRSPAFVSRSAKCQLTLDRASDTNGKIERNEIVPIPYTGGGNSAMFRGNEYWFAFSIWLPSSSEGADEWIGSNVYATLFQMKAPEFNGTGVAPGLRGPHYQLGPDYGYKASEGGVATGWRMFIRGNTGDSVQGTGTRTASSADITVASAATWPVGTALAATTNNSDWARYAVRYVVYSSGTTIRVSTSAGGAAQTMTGSGTIGFLKQGSGSWVTYEANLGSFAADKGKWTDFVFRVCPEYRNTWVDGNGVTQYATTEIWKDDVKVVSRIGFSNCVHNPSGEAYAQKLGIYCGWANPAYTTGPATKYVHYRAEWKLIQAIGNSSGTPCDTSNFAYQAVKPRGARASGT